MSASRRRLVAAASILATLTVATVSWAQEATPAGREWRSLAEGLSGDVGLQLPLRRERQTNRTGQRSQGEAGGPAALTASAQYSPTDYWFAAVTFYRYLDTDRQRPWNPTFAYRFGYDDWHEGTVSLVYANYGGNRLLPDDDRGERVTRFLEGTVDVQYKVPLSAGLRRRLLVHESGDLRLRVGYSVTPRYRDADRDATRTGKQALSLAVRYQPYGRWYVDATLRAYPISGQQQPWDPDIVYGFGYSDWRPWTVSVGYANYSGNRLPGREPAAGTGRFRDGVISLSARWRL